MSFKYIFLFIGLGWILSCDISKKEVEPSTDSSIPSSVTPTVPNEVGTLAGTLPDIKGISPKGDSISIRNIKAKYILLEFWASWCPPCRHFNPELVAVHSKYQSKGFEIFSISLDHDDSKWKAAIAKDNLSWPYHICDFKGWESDWARHFKIEEIPNNILFDEKGNILASGMEPEQLDKVLEKLFQK